MLFNEPKLPKSCFSSNHLQHLLGFSALQRAEIAEIFATTPRSSAFSTVSVLFNEPKLPKCVWARAARAAMGRVSVLFNEPKLPKSDQRRPRLGNQNVSVLFNEPKLPKYHDFLHLSRGFLVSVLFNEPKLPKFRALHATRNAREGFSALQRAEIAEICAFDIKPKRIKRFSALQRAEIAEIFTANYDYNLPPNVSVLFNEPKLPK